MPPNDCVIRRYDPADWDSIAEVHDAARQDELRLTVGMRAFRTLEQTAASEGLFNGELWVAVIGSRIVGFIAFDAQEVTWLYVHPDAYRRGVGRLLLRQAVACIAGNVMVSVLDGNQPAIDLYRSEGFAHVETRDGMLNGFDDFPARGHILVRSA